MTVDRSANEIVALVLKAARGGGLPLGYAEDLAAAARFMDFDALKACPCTGSAPAAIAIQTALDKVAAGAGAQTVDADVAMINAFAMATQAAWQKRLVWEATPTGAVFKCFEDEHPDVGTPKGRRTVPVALAAHLSELAAKTLVPETDASRQAGAGAGLTDND